MVQVPAATPPNTSSLSLSGEDSNIGHLSGALCGENMIYVDRHKRLAGDNNPVHGPWGKDCIML